MAGRQVRGGGEPGDDRNPTRALTQLIRTSLPAQPLLFALRLEAPYLRLSSLPDLPSDAAGDDPVVVMAGPRLLGARVGGDEGEALLHQPRRMHPQVTLGDRGREVIHEDRLGGDIGGPAQGRRLGIVLVVAGVLVEAGIVERVVERVERGMTVLIPFNPQPGGAVVSAQRIQQPGEALRRDAPM